MRRTRGGFRSADVNGDGLADFMLAFSRDITFSQGLIAIADSVAKPGGLDTHRAIPTDLDGDGRTDFVYIIPRENSTEITTLIATAQGSYKQTTSVVSPFQNPAVRAWKVADVDGDGRGDLVHLQCIQLLGSPTCNLQVDTLLSRGEGAFTRLMAASFPGGSADTPAWRPLDVDGDGRAELVHLDPSVNPDEGIRIRVLRYDTSWQDLGTRGPFQPSGGILAARSVRYTLNWLPADVDGDGRVDLVHVTTNAGSLRIATLLARDANTWELKVSPITNYSWTTLAGAGSEIKWRPFDVNGDGLTDLVRNLSTPNGMLVDTLYAIGDGNWREMASSPDVTNAAEAKLAGGALDWEAMDVNGDGLADLARIDRDATGLVLTSLNADAIGNWTIARTPLADPGTGGFRSRPAWTIADIDGDGRKDLARVDRVRKKKLLRLEVSAILARTPPAMLARYATGGGATSIAYRASSEFAPSDPAQGCMLPLGGVVQVVRSLVTSDGRSKGTRQRSTYGYACPRWFGSSREFSGWDDIVVQSPAAPNRAETRFYQRYRHTPTCGVQLMDSSYRDAAGAYYATREIVGYDNPKGQPYDCLPVQAIHLTYGSSQPAGMIAQNVYTYFSYDEFGNVTRLVEEGSSRITGDERATMRVFRPNTAAYIVDVPASEQVHAGTDASGPVVRAKIFCYDGDQTLTCNQAPSRGLLTRQLDIYEQGTRKTDFVYDAVGNLAGVIDANLHGVAYFYDPTYRVFPTGLSNAGGQVYEVTWDPVLLRATRIKMGDNTAPLILAYDPLGRMKRATLPQGGLLEQEYVSWGDPEKQHVLQRLLDRSADGLWTRQYVDGLGRVYRSVRKGAAPNEAYERLMVYGDASGLVYRISDWFRPGSSKPPYQRFAFDGASRLLRHTHADGTFICLLNLLVLRMTG